MAKRGLSLLLALVTLFSLSVPAFAEEAPVEEPEEVTEEVENEPVTAATSGTCGAYGNNVQWSFAGDTLTFSGNGAMQDFDTYYSSVSYDYESYAPWSNWKELIKNVVIQSGVTSIGRNAFLNCTALTGVTIPDGVVYIGDGAFSGCSSLTSVAIPGSVTSIGEHAFYCCYGLASVTISDGVTNIRHGAFWSSGLTSVTIPASVTSIGNGAFCLCWSLTSVTVLNPNCAIVGLGAADEGTFSALGVSTTVIHGYAGSTAEAYAKQYGYKFEALAPVITPKPQLAAPTVKIEKVSAGIKVSWNKVAGSPRYMVYYKEGSGSWKKIGTTTSTTYTRKAAQLKNGVTYTFTVRCCENDKKTLLGPYKASNSLKYTAQLAAPTVKIAKVSGGIKVSWNKIAGSPRYMVYYKENGGSWKRIGTTTATTYTRAAKYLKNGATYQFTVRCCENDKKTLLGPYKASNSLKYTK